MNKNNLCLKIAANTGLPREEVETVLDSLEEVTVQLLNQGDQLHWGGFFRAWTVLKRPALPSSKLRYKDTQTSKILYILPCCTFGTKVMQGMKKTYYNTADKDWKEKGFTLQKEEKEHAGIRISGEL